MNKKKIVQVCESVLNMHVLCVHCNGTYYQCAMYYALYKCCTIDLQQCPAMNRYDVNDSFGHANGDWMSLLEFAKKALEHFFLMFLSLSQ